MTLLNIAVNVIRYFCGKITYYTILNLLSNFNLHRHMIKLVYFISQYDLHMIVG